MRGKLRSLTAELIPVEEPAFTLAEELGGRAGL